MCIKLVHSHFSSPRAKRAGLKGLRAESARAVTGRRCPHSGTGQDFLARNGPNRTKTGVTRQRSERFGRAQRLNGANAEGYKRPVDKNRGPISKNGFSGRNPEFLAQKKNSLFSPNHVPATTGWSCQKEKVPFSQINISLIGYLGGLL